MFDFFDFLKQEIGVRQLDRILSKRRTNTSKADSSYVSDGDLMCDKIVRDGASLILGDPLIVSEEIEASHVASPRESQIVIVVDPIDGTENFVSGLSEWGTSISCYQNGLHIGSMIGLPELGQWIWTGCELERFESRISGLSSSMSRDDLVDLEEGYEYRIIGCCVYNIMAVVRGSFRSFENKRGASSWDILGGLNLALEHGLSVEVEGGSYAGEYLPPVKKYRFKIKQQ